MDGWMDGWMSVLYIYYQARIIEGGRNPHRFTRPNFVPHSLTTQPFPPQKTTHTHTHNHKIKQVLYAAIDAWALTAVLDTALTTAPAPTTHLLHTRRRALGTPPPLPDTCTSVDTASTIATATAAASAAVAGSSRSSSSDHPTTIPSPGPEAVAARLAHAAATQLLSAPIAFTTEKGPSSTGEEEGVVHTKAIAIVPFVGGRRGGGRVDGTRAPVVVVAPEGARVQLSRVRVCGGGWGGVL
jgi:hypothetical protein